MNLIIGDISSKPDVISGKEYFLPIESLRLNATHIFIASNHWEELHITLTDDIPLNVLKYVRMAVERVVVLMPTVQTEHTMELMCELYPEKSGKIHKAFMLHKDMKGVVMDG